MTLEHYILENRVPKAVPDLMTWARWMEGDFKKTRRVAFDQLGFFRVSTIFLGLDHNFAREGGPVLWETMVWWRKKPKNKKLWLWQDRCGGGWSDALLLHADTCRKVRNQTIFWT